jgi:hypothetical protein
MAENNSNQNVTAYELLRMQYQADSEKDQREIFRLWIMLTSIMNPSVLNGAKAELCPFGGPFTDEQLQAVNPIRQLIQAGEEQRERIEKYIAAHQNDSTPVSKTLGELKPIAPLTFYPPVA